MKNIMCSSIYCIICLILFPGMGRSVSFAEQANRVEITYVANHGFMITSGQKQIMIDTLFTQGGGRYMFPCAKTQTMMLEGKEPFQDVQLVLVTHAHGDHFDPSLTAEFLRKNPQALLVCPDQVGAMLANEKDFDTLKPQVVALSLGKLKRIRKTLKGIDLEVINIPHHLNDSVEHFAYLIEINGLKILHIGDAAKKPTSLYETLALNKEDIDILIAPFGADCSNWQVKANGDGIEKIRDYIKPKHVLMGHLPLVFDQEKTEAMVKELQEQLAGISVSVLHPQCLAQAMYKKQEDQIVIQKPTVLQAKPKGQGL